jgi:hypothetical protein
MLARIGRSCESDTQARAELPGPGPLPAVTLAVEQRIPVRFAEPSSGDAWVGRAANNALLAEPSRPAVPPGVGGAGWGRLVPLDAWASRATTEPPPSHPRSTDPPIHRSTDPPIATRRRTRRCCWSATWCRRARGTDLPTPAAAQTSRTSPSAPVKGGAPRQVSRPAPFRPLWLFCRGCPLMSRSRSVLPRGLGRGEGKQAGGGACRILEYGCMPEAGQHLDLRAGNRAVVRGG